MVYKTNPATGVSNTMTKTTISEQQRLTIIKGMHRLASLVGFYSVQFTLISTRSGKSICASPCTFSSTLPFKTLSMLIRCAIALSRPFMVAKTINAASFKEKLSHAYKITITYINSDTSQVDGTENHSGKYSSDWYWTPESRNLTEGKNMDVQGALKRSSTCEST